MRKRRSGIASGDTGRDRSPPASVGSPLNRSRASRTRTSSTREPDNVSAGASPRARPPPSNDALAKAVEAQRLQLVRVQAVVLSNISILRESYGLEVDGADICYCCEVVRDILERVIANLDSFRVIVASDCEPTVPLDAMALAHIVSAARHQLFRAQAVIRAVARVLNTGTKDSYEANLRVVFVALGEMMEETITKLEPMSLGLPTPELA